MTTVDIETNQKQKEKVSKMFIWACFFVYVLMMGSKNSYTAEIVAIQDVFGKTKAEASLAMTYYFVTYAIGQIVLALFMGKINLRVYLTVTASASAILTIMIGFMNVIEPIYVLCAINGALQAGIYSGCMQVLSRRLEKKLLPTANKIMSLGSSIASMISYGVPALFVALDRWDLPFKILGALFLVSAIFFFIAYSKIKRYPPAVTADKSKTVTATTEKPFIALPTLGKKIGFFVLMAFLTLLGNAMYYSTFNWVPNLLYEEFSMPQSYSILLTLLFPVVKAFVSVLTVNLCEKYVNIINVCFWMMLVSIVVFVPMIFMHDANIILSLVSLVLFIALGVGARQVFGGILAFKMRTQISSGGYLAFTNAFASLAAGIIPPIAGNIIDAAGYGTLFTIVLGIAVLYVAIVGVWSLMHVGKITKSKNK